MALNRLARYNTNAATTPTVMRWCSTRKPPPTSTMAADRTPDASTLGKNRDESRTGLQLAFELGLS